ncbi:Uncharacterised protein r2_g2503 [Pycnogonum litorale]
MSSNKYMSSLRQYPIHNLRHNKKSNEGLRFTAAVNDSRQIDETMFVTYVTHENSTTMTLTSVEDTSNTTFNSTFSHTNPMTTFSSSTIASTEEFEWRRRLYLVVVPVMLTVCLITILFNLLIFMSMKWVRRSISPTLCLNVSLALADAYASLIIGVGLIMNSLLPYGFGLQISNACYVIVLEAFRLSGPIISVLHLLALAINHYLGIVRPLHYASMMTKRAAIILIVFVWTTPCAYILIYFSSVSNEGFQAVKCSRYNFLNEEHFRLLYSFVFFIPLLFMSFIYFHIYLIVKKHQKGLTKYSSDPSLKKNIKATVTTLLILGT